MNFENAPAGLGLHTDGNAREFTNNRKLITSATNREKGTFCGPSRDGRIGGETGDSKTLGKEAELEKAGRKCHQRQFVLIGS